MKGKYKVDLKKEVFAKFFSVLKITPGSAVMKIDDKKKSLIFTPGETSLIVIFHSAYVILLKRLHDKHL